QEGFHLPWHNDGDASHPACLMIVRIRPRRGLVFAASLVLAALIACAPFRSGQPDTATGTLVLHVQPVAFNLEDRAATRIGKLVWRGGLALSADHAAFGGWSDLWVDTDGSSLRAVSDQGAWLAAHMRYDPAGRLLGLQAPHLGRLKAPDGTWLTG